MSGGESGARAARELLERDGQLRKKIFAYALRVTHRAFNAHELAQECIAKALDPLDSPWDPEKQPSLFLHLGSLMNGIEANRRRHAKRHPYVPDGVSEDISDRGATPEARLTEADEAREWREKLDDLRRRLAGDTLALGKLDLMGEGILDAPTQAKRLGSTVDEMYRARERIAYHAAAVVRARAKSE